MADGLPSLKLVLWSTLLIRNRTDMLRPYRLMPSQIVATARSAMPSRKRYRASLQTGGRSSLHIIPKSFSPYIRHLTAGPRISSQAQTNAQLSIMLQPPESSNASAHNTAKACKSLRDKTRPRNSVSDVRIRTGQNTPFLISHFGLLQIRYPF